MICDKNSVNQKAKETLTALSVYKRLIGHLPWSQLEGIYNHRGKFPGLIVTRKEEFHLGVKIRTFFSGYIYICMYVHLIYPGKTDHFTGQLLTVRVDKLSSFQV